MIFSAGKAHNLAVNAVSHYLTDSDRQTESGIP